MFRAAKRALRDLETAPVDELGRKAMQGVERGAEALEELARKAVDKVESVDRATAREIGKKAVEALDPRNLEQLAGSAGSELVGAVERVVGRVESFVSDAVRQAKSDPPPSGGAQASSQPSGAGSHEDAPGATPPSSEGEPAGPGAERVRVRVED